MEHEHVELFRVTDAITGTIQAADLVILRLPYLEPGAAPQAPPQPGRTYVMTASACRLLAQQLERAAAALEGPTAPGATAPGRQTH